MVQAHARSARRRKPASALLSAPGAAVRAVLFWCEVRRQRRALAEMQDHLLRDIGLTRDQARRECDRPFWSI